MTPKRVWAVAEQELLAYRGVSEPALLRQYGCFIAEGRTVVGRVIANSPQRIRSLLLNIAARDALKESLRKAGVLAPVHLCDEAKFEQLTGHRFHRGCLALVERPPANRWERIVEQARTLVLLEGVGNPDNVGSVFRCAAALGADAILLGPGTCDPLYRKAIRTSMATVFQLPFARLGQDKPSYLEALEQLGKRGVLKLALSLREPCVELNSWAQQRALVAANDRRPLLLMVGAEGSGLSPETEATADVRLRIAMSAGIDSLNLGVATAIALHTLRSCR